MRKIQRIFNFQCFLPFYLAGGLQKQREYFQESGLGKIHKAIPWEEFVKVFNLKPKRKGPSSIFPPQGKIALMFLKAYSQMSDKKLLEHINGNLYYQLFCGIYIPPGEELTNHKIISQIRCELAQELNIEETQSIFAKSQSI